MNITRDVMVDMLPVYFSGEASEDTKRLMEEYFRANPDFERIARGERRGRAGQCPHGISCRAPRRGKTTRQRSHSSFRRLILREHRT